MRSAPKFIPALSGIRAIAAITVVLSHSASSGFLPKMFLDGAASVGVMLFFSLSGFLMAYLYLWRPVSGESIVEYSAARIGRVYPLFAVVILFCCAMHYLDNRFAYDLDVAYAVQHLLLFGDTNTIWTIATEFYFYGLFIPIWVWCSSRSPSKTTFRLLAVVALLVFLLWLMGFPGGRIAITRYLHFFLLGMIAAAAHRHIRGVSLANWALPVSLVIYVLTLPEVLYWAFGLKHPGYGVLPAVLMASIVFFTAKSGPASKTSRVLGARPMVYIGELSFGLYLLHRPAMSVWRGILAYTGWEFPPMVLFICLVISLWVASHLANRLIEVPARRFINERSKTERSLLRPSPVDAGSNQEAANCELSIPGEEAEVARLQ
ncbi:acyltransferase family protein [Mesorhizobium escarrei]|uniref:Acyl_transf_3 domain-containing protein n=1 Tax=Mesorhizobium escarrei TaxID=666018 RepID=A0ABM9EB87_9HYPH|nr:acyltransferase [Mesorhizobium escarrei]CAH2406511.1 putative Acyl_transf_3 domain-containing protein [Mesorhizobium escarrei]